MSEALPTVTANDERLTVAVVAEVSEVASPLRWLFVHLRANPRIDMAGTFSFSPGLVVR